MKKFLLTFLLMILSVSISFAQFKTPNSVQTDQNNGYIDLTAASTSVSLAADETLNLNTILPRNTKGFKFNVFNGDVIVCGPDQVSTGTMYIGDLVASGTTYPGYTGLTKGTGADWDILICPRGLAVELRFTAW